MRSRERTTSWDSGSCGLVGGGSCWDGARPRGLPHLVGCRVSSCKCTTTDCKYKGHSDDHKQFRLFWMDRKTLAQHTLVMAILPPSDMRSFMPSCSSCTSICTSCLKVKVGHAA